MLARGLVAAAAFLTASLACATPAEPGAQLSRPDLIALASPSVVRVKAKPRPASPSAPARGKRDPAIENIFSSIVPKPKDQEGTGFVVDQSAGLVLTAAHIVAKAGEVTVELPGTGVRAATVAGIDEESGIALLRVSGALPPALAFTERALVPGEAAMIVGWMLPAGSVLALEGMVMGEIPAVSDEPTAPPLADYVALDAVIPNGGFGGSPVLDREGKVVGFVSAIYGRTYGPGALTLIIPSRGVPALIDALASDGRVARSVIGITTSCTAGACSVDAVEAGGPAALAGLRQGDRIVAIDGAEMRSDTAIRRAIAARPPGSQVRLRMMRGAQPFEVAVATSVAKQN